MEDRKIKGIKNDVKYYLKGGISRDINLKRIERYSAIIYSEIIEENRKLSGTTMMIKGPRKSDELTTNRAIHQNRAAGIAGITADKLGLNTRIVEIATQNHDLGHTPYGHSTEWWLSEIFKDIGMGYRCHNAIGVKRLIYSANIYDRIMDRIKEFNPQLSERKLNKIRKNLWLVLDPILCHNGESSKRKLMIEPNLSKKEKDFEEELKKCYTIEGYDKTLVPATAEGSMLRIVDVISYIGQDMVDGLREGIITDLDTEYRQLLNKFGIADDEIDLSIAKKSYDGLARKIEIEATKDLIKNSNKNSMKMSEEMLDLVCKLRDKNNRAIVNKVVRPTENEVFPVAIKQLLENLSNIYMENNTQNMDQKEILELQEKYQDTPYSKFATYLCNMTEEDYKFTVETTKEATIEATKNELEEALNGEEIDKKVYPTRARRIEEIRKEVKEKYPYGMNNEEKNRYANRYKIISENEGNPNFMPMNYRIGMAIGANYIETLNDRELVELFKETNLLTEEQLEDIQVKYKDLSEAELQMDTRQNAWKNVLQEQKEEERN